MWMRDTFDVINFKTFIMKMKRLKLNYSHATITSILAAIVIFYGCTKDEVQNSEEETATTFEKQLVITDVSGKNSITLNISSIDEELLKPHTLEAYELVTYKEIPKKVSSLDYEKSEPIASPNDYDIVQPAIRISVVGTDFKDKVASYSLISNVVETEVDDKLFCRWFPRTFSYYRVDNINASGITTTFGRTKNTCNNIQYHICEFNSTSPFRSYQLKHPGDEETTNSVGQGMTILYRYKKNSVVTFNWY